jgi:Ca-activated chloride channel family protein
MFCPKSEPELTLDLHMRISLKRKWLGDTALLLFSLLAPASLQDLHAGDFCAQQHASSAPQQQITIPNRPATPLFKGPQGKQKTEIHFDPSTKTVTLKLLVQDPNGYFIPNIHRDNFMVCENGVRQNDLTVDIEHAPVTLGVLVEFGGRSQALNRDVAIEISRAGRQLQDVLGPKDKVAVWKYSDKVEKVGESQGGQTLDQLFAELGDPQFSETNLYDAVIAIVQQMKTVTGRKAIVLISSGVDTFSKAKYEDALNAARTSDTPIYVLGLTRVLHDLIQTNESNGPLAHINWQKPEKQLQEIATSSGGRLYSPDTMIDLSAIYDDIMENLRVRYVITYRSSSNADPRLPRTVRVELIDPNRGGPLEIVDQSGRTIRADVVLQDTYVPDSTSAGQ